MTVGVNFLDLIFLFGCFVIVLWGVVLCFVVVVV